MRILLVEDNSALASLILKSLGKVYIFDLAENLHRARYFVDTKNYDLFIIDVLLPDGKGCLLCDYLIKNRVNAPILFLTAELDLCDKVAYLKSGADYLLKPFSIEELVNKITTLLHQKAVKQILKLKKANLLLNHLSRQVYINRQEIKLNRKEFALLELLIQHRRHVLSKNCLAEKVWQNEQVLFSNTIETTIARLRHKLGKEIIKTVKGSGYIIK